MKWSSKEVRITNISILRNSGDNSKEEVRDQKVILQ